VGFVDDEAEDLNCPTCNGIITPDEQECYMCGTDLVDTGLNYDIADPEDDDNVFN